MNSKTDTVLLLRIDRDVSTHTSHPRHLHPPLDLKYIQAAVHQITGQSVPFMDGWLHAWSPSQLTEKILPLRPQMVVIKAATWCIDEAVFVGKRLRGEGITTIAVGQHVSHVSKLDHRGWKEAFDIPVPGEPEEEVPLLIKRLLEGESVRLLAPYYFDRMEKNKPFLVQEPDQMPKPCFDEKEFSDYAFPFPIPGNVAHKWGYVLTSWGCPRKCRHCSEVVRKTTGTILRTRNPVRVADEIASLLQAGADAICFEDDSLFCNRRHFLNICEEIIRRGLHFPWISHARPDELDEERIAAAAKAGAVLLKVGVESGASNIIETIGKSASGEVWLDKVEKGFALLQQYNVGSVALFMVGIPHETEADVEKSIALAKKIKPDYIQIQIFCTYPDSSFFDQLEAPLYPEGLYHYLRPAWSPSRIPPDKLPLLQSRFYNSFYLRPEYVIRHIRQFWRFYTNIPNIIRIMNWINLMRRNLFAPLKL